MRKVSNNFRKLQKICIRYMSEGHHDHHSRMMPPFARLPPPDSKLPEEIELVWNDSVAPETCIDYEAPHVSDRQVFTAFGLAISFFPCLYGLIALSDPVSRNPVALRSTVLPYGGLLREQGYDEPSEEREEED